MSDDPEKARDAAAGNTLAARLLAIIGEAREAVGVVSAYFVPTDAGTAFFTGLARRGVRVDILTNALNSNDVAVVHAGYAKHRKALLSGGVRLWEMRGTGKAHLKLIRPGSGSFGGSGGAAAGTRRPRGGPVLRSTGSSLHAKTFTMDRQRFFIGSFNFDPRSADLNTEMGLLVECPRIAAEMQQMFDTGGLRGAAWQVGLAKDGRLNWVEYDENGEPAALHRTEPRTGPLQRSIIRLFSRLPIDWLL